MKTIKPICLSLLVSAALVGSAVYADTETTNQSTDTGSSTTVTQPGATGDTQTTVNTTTQPNGSGGTSTTVDTSNNKGSSTSVHSQPNGHGGTSTTVDTQPSD